METATPKPRRKFKDLGITLPDKPPALIGDSIEANMLFGREIAVLGGRIEDSTKFPGTKCAWIQIEIDGAKRALFSSSSTIIAQIAEAIKKDGFPFDTVMVKNQDKSHKFT